MLAQVSTALLLLVAVVGVGAAVAAWASEGLGLNAPTTLSLVPLSGLAAVGVTTLAVGHLALLGPWLPYLLALLGLGAVALRRRAIVALGMRVRPSVATQARLHWAPVAITVVAFGMAVAATLAAPSRTDEIEYHWPAPLAWAQAGGWNDSTYRHVDAFPFMEVIYTAAAVQGSYVAAHVLHLITLPALGFAAAGIARSLGMRGTAPVTAAAMLMPVAWDSAYLAYNDTAVGAFAIGGAAVALGSRRRLSALLAIGLLCTAASIKPTAAVAAAAVALMVLLQGQGEGQNWRAALRRATRFGIAAAAGVSATLIFWSVRLHWFTGQWIDPAWTEKPDAYAQTMLPTPLEQALAPLLPFVSGIIGAQEPWGARTSLVVQIGLVPALIAVVIWRGKDLRRFVTVALPAWVHWIVLGFAIVRTRFHIFTWVLLVVSIRSVVESAYERSPRWRRLELVWTAAVGLSAFDVSVDMVRTISTL